MYIRLDGQLTVNELTTNKNQAYPDMVIELKSIIIKLEHLIQD